jgi:dTMP kinase
MQLRVRNFFHRIGKEMDNEMQSAGGTRWISIDAGRGREEVEHDVWRLVEPLVTHGVSGPVGKLWTTAP